MAAVIVTTTAHPRRSIEPLVGRPPLQVLPGGRRAARAHVRSARLDRPVALAVYRRRRLGAGLALVSVLLVAYLAIVGFQATVSGAGASPTHPATATAGAARSTVYVVQPGDTLWSIARSLHPRGDIRAVVDRLESRLGTATVQPGQRVSVDGLTS